MKIRLLLLAGILFLYGQNCFAQDFQAWLGTWDVSMFYKKQELQDQAEVWKIDETTDTSARGTATVVATGDEFTLIITWDEENRMYFYDIFMMELEGTTFNGVISVEENIPGIEDVSIKGVKRPEDGDNGGGGGEPDDDRCPIRILIGDKTEHIEMCYSFRDEKLLKTEHGRDLVRLYYIYGPAVCNVIRSNDDFRKICRKMLLVVVPVLEYIM